MDGVRVGMRWWARSALLVLVLVTIAGCQPTEKPATAPKSQPTQPPIGSAPSQPPALLCGGPSGQACRLSLFATEPEDGVVPFADRLNQATVTIDFAPFLLDAPGIIQALVNARQRGVRVRLLTEPSHDKDNARALKVLGAAGAEIRSGNPTFGLTHAKYAVLDGSRSLIMTFNSTMKELPTHRDFAIEDTNPNDAQFFQELFNADWDRTAVGSIPDGFALSPDNADQVLPTLVRSAQRSLDVYAEKLEASPLMDAILDDARRGVAVRILADEPNHGKVPKPLLDLARRGQLQIRVPSNLGVHAKVIVLDGTTAYFGSENIEDAVGDRRRELGLMFEDGSIVGYLRQVFDRDWAAPAES